MIQTHTRNKRANTIVYRSFDLSQHLGKIQTTIGARGLFLVEPLDGSTAEYVSHNDIIRQY